MKKVVFVVAALTGLVFITPVVAQKEKEKSKSSEQIIIRKKGDKDTKITIETKGDEIFINGKPLSEYKDDDVSVSKGGGVMRFKSDGHDFHMMDPDAHGYSHLYRKDSSRSFGPGDKRGFLGVTTEKDEKGARISNVNEGSAAEKAGLKEGDLITKVGDKVINTPDELSKAISAFKPKDEVRISYTRDGKQSEAKATLSERSFFRSFSFDGPGAMQGLGRLEDIQGLKGKLAPEIFNNYNWANSGGKGRLGIKIQDTENESGVKIMDVDAGSAAEKAGLKKDDVLVEIAGKKVSNTDEAREELAENKDKTEYKVKAKRGGSEMSFDVKITKKLKTTNL
ncbi:MAG: PDZ domain-containing protein [Chitinophagaceae bacterium]